MPETELLSAVNKRGVRLKFSTMMMAAVSGYLLSACVSTAKMAAPENATALAQHGVTGANPLAWQKPVAFGRWHTLDTTDYGRVDGGIGVGKAVLGGTFHARALVTNDNITAKCAGWLLNIGRKGLTFDPAIGNIPLLSCSFSGTFDSSFSLKENYANHLIGEFKTAYGNYTVKSEHRFQGSSLPSATPLGFTIYRQNLPLWSVDKLNSGLVTEWQNLPVEQQNLLAALSMVLLVTDFENLRWD